MEYLIIIVLQLVYIVFKEILHYKERERMRRIEKASSVGEYVAFSEKPIDLQIEKEDDNLVSLENVKFSDIEQGQ